jgi:peptidoglycan hydrolase-like protein with peptidoglycan-binding domain
MVRIHHKGECLMTHDEIKWFQTKMNELGHAKPPLKVDGVVGHDTEAALKAFQKVHGLREDGLPGPLTKAAIEKSEFGG